MLTVKYVDGDGVERLTECRHVVADRTIDGMPRVLVFDEIPDARGSNNSGIYVDEGMRSTNGQIGGPVVYIMNRFGATVATYRLQAAKAESA